MRCTNINEAPLPPAPLVLECISQRRKGRLASRLSQQICLILVARGVGYSSEIWHIMEVNNNIYISLTYNITNLGCCGFWCRMRDKA